MSKVKIPRHVLQSVVRPARYVGGEWNSVVKTIPPADSGAIPLTRFAFCFPDIYDIGMSNLALHILYHVLNERADTWCERSFAPWTDMEEQMRRLHLPLYSLESYTPLAEFDFVGFTLQYELAYTNVLNMLDLAGIPLLTAERTDQDPLVVAGGPVVYNIEPMADFFDLVMIGEGEEMIGELMDLYRKTRDSGHYSRSLFLEQAARIEGVYVPSFYTAEYHEDGTLSSIKPNRPGIPEQVSKRIILDLDKVSYPAEGLVPNTEIVHDRMALEVFRGCARGCRFCQAGMIYRPVREKSVSTLVDQAKKLEQSTGYDEISLLSLSTSDYRKLPDLASELNDALAPNHTSLSVPSLRLDSFSLDLMEKVSRTRKSGLTFAPEAGTQRLRDVINKNIAEDDLLQAMTLAFQGGWNGAKLYFMVGLPTETMADIEGIVDLVHKLEQLYRDLPRDKRPRKLELTVSTALFIPKPFTPFQWVGQMGREQMKERTQFLRDNLRSRSVKYQYHDSQTSLLEAVLARGDRRLGPVILSAWRRGRTFDAWDDHFVLADWLDCLSEAGLDPDFYATRERPADEVFPWSHLDCSVSQEFLYREYQKALAGETTPQCRVACSDCGAACFGGGICFEC